MTIVEGGVIVSIAISLMSGIFGLYNRFHKPQEDIEKKQAVQEALEKKQEKSEHDVEGKASLLAQQLQWKTEGDEKRFAEMKASLDCSNALAQNHIHTIDTKIEIIQKEMGEMKVNILGELVRLSTIIDERIPKKQ